jgi:DNA-binding transcriptional LysR family regulator
VRRGVISIQRIIVIWIITMANIASVNLNLLVAFDALVQERSVTRAAARIGVTQSAVSNALAQLRGIFDDPLFLRGSRGVTPTPRALELSGAVRQGLALLEGALAPAAFDPASSTRGFVLAASDHVELVLLPPLLQRLASDAPGVRVEVRPWGLHEVPDALARGEIDLMIGFYGKVPPQHDHAILFEEDYVCIARRGHPRVGKRLTLERWIEAPHVLVSERHGSPGSVDRALAARGLERRVGARVSHFLLVPALVARTDLVAAVGRRVAEAFAPAYPIRIFPPPLPLPRGRVGQVWHQRVESDPGHRWLRGVIAEVAKTV